MLILCDPGSRHQYHLLTIGLKDSMMRCWWA